jgi:cytosine deaminase
MYKKESDVIIKNAKLRDTETLRDIHIAEGKIQKIVPSEREIPGPAGETSGTDIIDAAGNLVIPPLVDPHVHLDAVLSAGNLSSPNVSGTLLEAIGIWNEWKRGLSKDVLLSNARAVMKWYIANGVLYVRTHADCSDPTLLTVESLIELREEFKDKVDLQVVAFPQNGVFTSREGEALMRRALSMGADVVGGAPHIEYTREDGVREVEFVYELAEEYDKLIDIHCDETGDPQSRFVEVMAKESIMREMEGRAAASHTTAMHNYNNDYAFKLIGNLAKAGMNMITNPFDNAVLQNRTDGYPRKRGVTRADEMLAKGINVCIGHDSIMDPWYSMGKGNMIMAANLFAHLGHMNGHTQLSQLMDMITVNSAKTMNIESAYGIHEGKPANLVILDAGSDAETIRLMPECLYVIRNGNVICRTAPAKRTLNIGTGAETVDFKY